MADNKHETGLLQRAQQLCSSREYCTSDIAARLEQWGEKDSNAISRIIAKLADDKFIDDKRYSRAFVSDHFRYQKWGRKKISISLKMKKIPEETISSALATIDEEEYRGVLRNIIETHRKSVKAKNRFDLKNKLLRHALAKGYESNLVYEIINSLFED